MKREIKFRAWDGTKMFTFDNHAFDLIYNDISGWNVAPNIVGLTTKWTTGESSDTAEQFQLKQYTGLHDKNGKEVYHKDIVASGKKHYTVEWQDELARFWLAPLNHTGNWQFPDEVDHMEIIGNRFEHPHLLTPQQVK